MMLSLREEAEHGGSDLREWRVWLLYGDGVFEGIRAYNGRVFRLDRHVSRLFDSAKAMRLELPVPAPEMERIILDTCRENGIEDGYIRVVVTRGVGELGIDPRSCGPPQVIVIAKSTMALYEEGARGVRWTPKILGPGGAWVYKKCAPEGPVKIQSRSSSWLASTHY